MSTHQHGTIEDTIYLFFGANDTSGSGDDGATPVWDVRLAGATSTDAPVLSGAATLLTHANFPDGAHEVGIDATVANGFAANATYAVFCTLLVDSQNPTGFLGSFTLTPLATAEQVSNIGSGATGGTHVEASYDNTNRDTIDNAAAVDKGSGLVGIPVTGHAFVTGREVTIAGTVNYNGAFEVISQTTNEVVITDTFVSETFGGAETIVASIKGIVFVGTVTSGTLDNTSKENGVSYSFADDSDEIDVIFGYSIGGSREATSAALFTNVNGNTDQMVLSAYDFPNSQWEPDGNGILSGSGGSSFAPLNPELVSRNTGVSVGEIGDVFLRFHTVTTTPSSLDVDKCLVVAVGTNVLIGYPNGYEIAAGGESGTVFGRNGTAGRPCPYADAQTMNAANPLNMFHIHNGETVNLGADSDGISLVGEAWTLGLGGTTAGTFIRGANMSGTSTGEGYILDTCTLGAVTMAPGTHRNCIYTDASTGFTMGSAGTYFINDPRSGVAGNTAPVFTWDGGGTSKGNFRAISTGVKFEAMAAGDIATVEGLGQFIEGTCPGGAVTVRGNLTLSGISNIEITDEARFSVDQITGYEGPLDTDANGAIRIVDGVGARELNTNGGRVESDLVYIHGTALTETSGQLAAAFVKLFDVATPLLVASDPMVGTDGANQTVPDAAGTASTLHSTTDALITGISNVTRLSVAIPTYLERPPSGDKAIKVSVALKDTDGNMEDPDANQLALLLANSGGTSRNSLLFKDFALSTVLDAGTGTFSTFKALEREGVGLYFCYFKVAFDATEEEWLARFGWEEGAIALYEFRATQVTDAANDLGVLLTRCSEVRMAELDAANLPADIDLILEDTGTTLPAQITALENLSSADAQAAADAALVANHLDHLFKTDYDPASKPGTATALWNELIENNAGVSRYTAAALAQGPTGSGGDATEDKQDTIITHLIDVKGTSFAKDTDSLIDLAHRAGVVGDTLGTLSDQIDGIVGGTGTGARTVAVTVNDGAAVLENATVRFTEGANTFVGSTDASGELSFSLDDATYSVAISKAGYTFTPTTLVVDGDKTPTYSMTIVSITAPPNAATTTGVMTVYDEEGSVESGVTVTVQILAGPGTDGIGYDSTEWAELSDALGVVEFAGIILGARYQIWRGTSKADVQTFTAPTSGTSFDLAEVIGRG